jgi:hypothetical protein
MIYDDCSSSVTGKKCEACNSENLKYQGLIFHDLRRTAARNLRRAGVAEEVIQKIGGWRTRSVFERYAIVTQSDIMDAMESGLPGFLGTTSLSATPNGLACLSRVAS